MIRFIRAIILVAIGLSVAGCGNGDSETQLSGDAIEIRGFEPSSAVAGVATTFSVEVAYSVESDERAIIYAGFNSSEEDGPNHYFMRDSVIVDKGAGTVTLNDVDVVPVDWPEPDSFELLTTIEPYVVGENASNWDADWVDVPVSAGSAKLKTERPIAEDTVVCTEQAEVGIYCVDFGS